jgi:8-oxo-dGTP pyrophosphatase MutT (NUDIX family)
MTEPDRIRLPARYAEIVRRFAESGQPPVVPRVAATVVLLREADADFEVFALRRAASMAFAPGAYAFPGGSVDPRDSEVDVAFAGPASDWWAARLGVAPDDARAVVCAAVREVFEECGVLLAGPNASTVVGDVSAPDWEAARVALLNRDVGLADLLAERNLVLRSDLLVPWDRWVTPEFESRRFDTYFFLARMPADQRTQDVGGEADHTIWDTPASLGVLPMLPPTAYTLRQLAGQASVADAMAAGQSRNLATPFLPQFATDDLGPYLLRP